MPRPKETKILFKDFKGRNKALKKITRFDMYKPMFYRTNLLIHSKRVFWLTREISPYAKKVYGKKYDQEKTEIMALIHDDPEIIMGDIMAGNKSKMTKKQLLEIAKAEKDAIKKILKRFPEKIERFNYRNLLELIFKMNCLEAKIMDLADKLDAFGESLHEAFGGNYIFSKNVINQYGRVPNPFEYYIGYLRNFSKKFPDIKILLKEKHPLFIKPKMLNFKKIALSCKPHTKSSIKKKTNHLHYNAWKKVTFKYANKKELALLYQQKEYLIKS